MLNKNYVQSLKNAKEYPHPIRLGYVSKSLKGIYIQNGPGEFDRWGIMTHPFDGDGYIRKIEFIDGAAYFQGRYIQTWQRQVERFFHQRLFTGAFGSAPKYCLLKNPVNTNVVFLEEATQTIAASSEMGKTYLLDVATLETLGTHTTSISAHTHNRISVERHYPATGSTQLIFSDIDAVVSSVVQLEIPHFIYFHDFIVTPDYFLFFDHGLAMDLSQGYLNGWVNGIEFKQQASVLYLVNRLSGVYQPIPLPEVIGFSYHFICGKQKQNQEGVIDVEIYYILYPKFFTTPSEECQGQIYKTTIVVSTETEGVLHTDTECVHTAWVEMPIYDPKTEECFVILPKYSGLGVFHTVTHEMRYYSSPGKIFNEPFYDENFVMSLVYDSVTQMNYLYIFDRHSNFQEPKTILNMPLSIPMGLHGCYRQGGAA